MYGPLLILIILIPLFLIGLFWVIAPYQLYGYHERRTKYTRPGMGDYESEFQNMKYEIRELKEAGRDKELATLQKHYKKATSGTKYGLIMRYFVALFLLLSALLSLYS